MSSGMVLEAYSGTLGLAIIFYLGHVKAKKITVKLLKMKGGTYF